MIPTQLLSLQELSRLVSEFQPHTPHHSPNRSPAVSSAARNPLPSHQAALAFKQQDVTY